MEIKTIRKRAFLPLSFVLSCFDQILKVYTEVIVCEFEGIIQLFQEMSEKAQATMRKGVCA